MELKEILKAARERLHVENLTPMQHEMAEVKAPEVVLVAPTGSGKTLAFALPVLRRIHAGGVRSGAAAVVIAPARELVLQIAKVMGSIAPGLRVTALYGGHSMLDETRSLESAVPDVVVGTPGRLLDHINRRHLDLRHTSLLVLDEYDKSLELGFAEEMKRIVRSMQSVGFMVLTSATALAEYPDFLKLKSPLLLDYSSDSAGVPRLDIRKIKSPVADKLDTLVGLLGAVPHERTIVFVNHRESAERVHSFLVKRHFPAALYHGAMDQQDRETAIDMFANGTSPILVATDLAARGLDIPQAESVIHYHLPVQSEVWTHRNGRAGRMGADGAVYVITGPGEKLPEAYAGLPLFEPEPSSDGNTWRRTMLSLYFHAGKREKLSKGDIMGALVRQAGIAPDSVGLIAVHDHRAIAAVKAADAAAAVLALNAGKIKGRRIRVSMIK